jgi:uncharacterized tellurite resistance protein B-like protein
MIRAVDNAIEREIHVAVRAVIRDGIAVLPAEVRRLVGVMHGLRYDRQAVELTTKRFTSELQRALDAAARRQGRSALSRRQRTAMLADINAEALAAFARLNRRTGSMR